MPLRENQHVVKGLAKEFRGKTERLNCFDANVCKSDFRPTRPWETKYLPGDLFEFEVRFLWCNHHFRASANNDYVLLALRLNDVVCSPIFTVNRPDTVMGIKIAVKRPRELVLQVYSSDKASAAAASGWLSNRANLRCVKSFTLGPKDSLHVYANQLKLYLHNPSRETVVEMLSRLVKLLSHLHLVSEDAVDLSVLPEAFQNLKPFIEKWAISDDHERSLLVDKASRQVLTNLVQNVHPHIDAISKYLDSFGDRALSDNAILLGTLAECAMEAKLRLEKSKCKSTELN